MKEIIITPYKEIYGGELSIFDFVQEYICIHSKRENDCSDPIGMAMGNMLGIEILFRKSMLQGKFMVPKG